MLLCQRRVVSMSAKKRYTISDIAKAANVSTTTISRYLNGHYEYMSEETRDRIRFIIDNCGYRPSVFAKGLKMNRSNLIGIILPVASTNMSSHFIHRICMACAKTKYNPLFMSIEMDETKRKEMYKEAMTILYYDDPAAVFTNQRRLIYCMSENVEGFQVDMRNAINYTTLKCRAD